VGCVLSFACIVKGCPRLLRAEGRCSW
jgi:hypothetical protein